ncbi:hypothetical protein [Amycolatopsis sp. NPDC098790]|uniref:hypothetical protein n=1 Tax=Amycolatopsis sp. NPDC098790 TaxID=3363939 RepID=UPI00380E0A4D
MLCTLFDLPETPVELGPEAVVVTAQADLNQRLVELRAASAAAGLDSNRLPGQHLNVTEMIKTVS